MARFLRTSNMYLLEFPGSQVVDSVLPEQGAWVRSLVGGN